MSNMLARAVGKEEGGVVWGVCYLWGEVGVGVCVLQVNGCRCY